MPIITGKSRYNTSVLTMVGLMIAGNPMTPRELKIFEPRTLPIAISFSPFTTLAIEAAISGRLVPIATMVRPMIKSLMPRVVAIVVGDRGNVANA